MKISNVYLFIILSGLTLFSCEKKEMPETEVNTEPNIISQVYYTAEGTNYISYAAYLENSEKMPVVMIIPEWWGLNDYVKGRAQQLAEMGYFAIALDFYGKGQIAETPEEAQNLAMPFYENPELAKKAFDAAKKKLNDFPSADTSKIAVIGYCFGGAQALNMARQDESLKGVASFHGNLMTGVKPNNNSVKILVLNGEADGFVPKEEIKAFKSEMDSAKIDYKFIDYPGALHAFTNPGATEMGEKFDMEIAYNKEADEKSWNELKSFLNEIFK